MLDLCSPILLADPAARTHPLSVGRTSWWLCLPGLDGGRQWFDLAGQSHGTLTNMTTSASGWRGTARPGGAGHLLLDGVDDAILFGSAGNFTSQDFTIGLWANLSTLVNNSVLLSKGQFTVNGYYLQYQTAPGFVFTTNQAGVTQFSTAPVSSGTWTRFIIRRVGPAVRIYQNGSNTTVTTASHTDPVSSGDQLCLGGYAEGTALPFGAAVDDLSLWSRALSDAEIRADYDLSRAGYPGLLNRVRPAPLAASAAGRFPRHLFYQRSA